MADTSGDIAARAVAIACATTSKFVKVLSLDPLSASPQGLFDLRFKEVGIINDAQIEAFRSTLIHLVSNKLQADIRSMELSPDIIIGLVVNLVEDLYQNLP